MSTRTPSPAATIHLICNAHLDPVWLWEWEEGAAAKRGCGTANSPACRRNTTFPSPCCFPTVRVPHPSPETRIFPLNLNQRPVSKCRHPGRSGQSAWSGPNGPNSRYENNQTIRGVTKSGPWLQYRLALGADKSLRTPRVTQVALTRLPGKSDEAVTE